MRISPKLPQSSGLLCGLLVLLAGCGSPSSQTLDSLTVTATPTKLSVGGAAILKAVAHLSDGTTQDVTAGTKWTLSNPTLATMSSSALTAKAAGSLTVQAAYVEVTPAGTSPAAATVTPQALSASTQITITAAGTSNVPTITWNAPAAISYGTALSTTQLSATANIPGTFAYTPAAGTVLSAGTQTLSAIFTPTDLKTYSAATATVPLSVNKAAPAINWPQPAPVAVGATLSATQLNATASVPGGFMYSPAAGTVLAAGTQQLTAVFSPTDTTDYASATAHASLVVGTASGPSGPTGGPITPSRPTLTGCGGPTVNVNSGMSQSTLQSTIQSAPHCALVLFAAGTYTITSPITVPCSVSLGGPPVGWAPGNIYTAKINSAVSAGNYPLNFPACTAATSIQYLSCNGGRPSPDGGGCIYIAAGVSNITVTENYLYGNQGNAGGGNYMEDSLLYFDGSKTATVDSNDTITWNQFGQSGDCSNLMSNYSYGGLSGNGGFCNGLGIHDGMSNMVADYNIFSYQEQGMKVFENQGQCVNCYIEYNDFNNIHRIMFETQANIGGNQPTSMFIDYNSIHDQYDTNYGSWGFSAANGCNSGCVTHTDYNVLINNVQAANGGQYTPGAIEIWGSNGTTDNYNLVQGYWANGLDTSSDGQFVESNNTFCMAAGGSTAPPGSGGYFNNENENPQPYVPTATGNTFSNSPTCAQTSVTPTISPASGSFTGSQTVTFTTTGANRDANTGVWYTTDGSTPVPGSGTALYVPSGGTATVTTNTVKAVGMWGAQNQPVSYPSGYGYVPSAVVTANYTSGSVVKQPGAKARSAVSVPQTAPSAATTVAANAPAAAAATSVAIVPAQAVVAIGSTTQLKAIATFNDGSTKDVTTEFAWASSDTRTVAATASGSLSGLATGKAVITGSYQGLQASASAASSIGEVEWSSPIVISEGGTYSGNWQSTDAKTPAVTVTTKAPVVIENSHIRSAGSLIKTTVAGSNLTVRNSLGVAANAAVKGQPNGTFLEVSSPAKLDVENNYIENAQGGVIVHGYSGNRDGEQTIVIRSNRARNLNGLLSDGNGGYLPGEGVNHSTARFIQLDSVQSVPGVDVGWNEVINYPGRSLVEDNIDVYRSGGTPNRPLEIHDTYIQGAYPYKAAQDAYTGGGIKTDAKAGDNAQEVPAFNSIHDNQVVGTVSYGIAFTAGHDNVAANNRVVSSGLLADGTRIAAQHVGMANSDATGGAGANGSMYNNTMRDNLIGWTCWSASCAAKGYRKDQYFPASPADYSTNSVLATGQITLNTENSEYQIWMNKMAAAGIAVGPSF
jgi:Bacterial Ig-like domain (group 2)/Chitobiase/beta-hexosaminidase C-terminal domain